ncbi:1-phosphatidylinositol-4,5-bisphosphate phosphodiesterase [Fusarium denticulatum]|uniref:Phosphoinositide phospholipase C n=1 Tax=Fusarium denticulatum TaxID=48507 RepID=A0A8H5XF74_9HYPO|nr:1-phosphatidylinositol-4,5-bisphosphate phosphodiesterase [Fusarium denticulatum]
MDLMSLTARDLSNKCLEAFQICLTFPCPDPGLSNQQASHDERFEYRLADFNLWIDGIGALAPSKASLDARLSERPIDLSLVKGNLVMLFQSLEDCLNLLEADGSLEDALLDIDSALESLVTLSLAIRRTGRRSRLHKADRLFKPEEHAELKKHLEAIVLLRPGSGPCFQDDEFQTKIKSLTPLQNHLVTADLKRRNRFIQAQLHSLGLKKRSVGFELPAPGATQQTPNPALSSPIVAGEISSPIPSDTAEQARKSLPAPMSVTSASIPESVQPQMFTIAAGRCWNSTFDKTTRQSGYVLCAIMDVGEDVSAIISSSAQKRMGIESCPLCEVKGDADSSELIDHVLEHVHDFSLRSLPWPRPSEVDIGGEVGSFNPESGEAVAVTQWLEGYEHETEDIDTTPKVSTCDYGRLAIITEQIESQKQDKLGLDIGFADEHGDESAEAETDISQLTQHTTESAGESAEERRYHRCLDCSTIIELEWGDPTLQCAKCQSKRIELVGTLLQMCPSQNIENGEQIEPANDPDRKAYYAAVLGLLEAHQSIPPARESTSGFRRLTDRLFSRKKPFDIDPQDRRGATDNLVQFLGLKQKAVENQKAWEVLIKSSNAYDAIKEVLYFGYRSIDLDVWNGTTNTEEIDLEENRSREAKPGQTAKTLNRLFGSNRATQTLKSVAPKITVSSPTEPSVTDGYTLMAPCGFREACQVIRESAFVNSDLPVIINLEVHADSEQQEMMVKIMKEEWSNILVDKPLEGCDPRFRLPTLEDLRGRILIRLGTTMSPSVPSTALFDPELLVENHRRPGRVPVIQPLAELGVYLRREKFDGFTDMRTNSPTHLFSMPKGKVQELISTSPTKLFRHNKDYFFRVYPNSARLNTSNLDPLRFWRYGIQMVDIARHNVDEGMMLNEGMFADESGWVLKPNGYRSLNMDNPTDPEEAPRKGLELNIFVFKDQQFTTSTGREIKNLASFMMVSLHINDEEKPRVPRQELNTTENESGALGYNLNFLVTRAEATIIPKLCILR